MKKKNYFYLAALSHVATTTIPRLMVAEKIRSAWTTVLKTPLHGVTICTTWQCC